MGENVILTRKHRILQHREEQLRYNLAAVAGGRPYIDLRLHRAPNESTLSWDGVPDRGMPGRKQRAYLLNDAGRISAKINQYLFAAPTTRTGIEPDFAGNVTKTGVQVDRFWERVSELFTAGQWVWIRIDRGAPDIDETTGRPRARTVAQREAKGDKIYWSVYTSTDVVDWSFDDAGRLQWLLTRESQYVNDDPMAEASESDIRVLWRRGKEEASGATWERWQGDKAGKPEKVAAGSISMPEIPFLPVGAPSDSPWWFDDVEMIQCALLNLSSLHHENLVKTVYPQLVVPLPTVHDLEAKLVTRAGMRNGESVAEVVRELIRGLDRAFVEDAEHKGVTRYLQPSAQDLDAIPNEENRRRKALFDAVGLALFNRETRQVQSAESKAFDHLDTEATLRHRAMLLQEAETRLIALSARLDTTFRQYSPVWPTQFDVVDVQEDVAVLTQVANFTDLVPSLRRQLLKAAVKLVDQVERITPEDRARIMAEIDAQSDNGTGNAPLPA